MVKSGSAGFFAGAGVGAHLAARRSADNGLRRSWPRSRATRVRSPDR